MAKTEVLHIRVNDTVKENAEHTLGLLGMSISEAVNIFLHQVNLSGGLPFEVRLPAPERITVRSEEELIQKLEEADVAAAADSRRLIHEEVFDSIRRRINE